MSPDIAGGLRLAFGALFIYAAVSKFAGIDSFATLLRLHGLDGRLAALFARVLPALELLVGLGVALAVEPALSTTGAVALLAVFTIAMARNAVRAHPLPCGCFGDDDEVAPLRSLTRLGVLWLAVAALVTSPTAFVASWSSEAVVIAIAWLISFAWTMQAGRLWHFVRTPIGPPPQPHRYSFRADTEQRIRERDARDR